METPTRWAPQKELTSITGPTRKHNVSETGSVYGDRDIYLLGPQKELTSITGPTKKHKFQKLGLFTSLCEGMETPSCWALRKS
jgi:hypothetical protein